MPRPPREDDLLITSVDADTPPAFFDRFYFNLHGTDPTPLIMVGAGVHPVSGIVDGYVVVVDDRSQRSLRLSTSLDGLPATRLGPLSWESIVPLDHWRLTLDQNPTGATFDLEWRARTAPWATEHITIDDGRGGLSDFGHFFQSGRYAGTAQVDGRSLSGGLIGQRDRSRGVRLGRERLGMHLWIQAQFDDFCVALLYNEDREGRPTHCDGAVLHEDGRSDPVVAVSHALVRGGDLEVTGGRLDLTTAAGHRVPLDVEVTARGGYLAGAGYGGWHGQPRGRDHSEFERWETADGAGPKIRDLATPMVDAPARFRVGRELGAGVFEYAFSRSSSFVYRPRTAVQ